MSTFVIFGSTSYDSIDSIMSRMAFSISIFLFFKNSFCFLTCSSWAAMISGICILVGFSGMKSKSNFLMVNIFLWTLLSKISMKESMEYSNLWRHSKTICKELSMFIELQLTVDFKGVNLRFKSLMCPLK